ncbi:MAG: integration host factor subunit beta [Cytophagales bacterium]|nr:MAG: integration host factor subunit beta [Cytophagales bacterium]
MTKAQLVSKIANQTGINKSDVLITLESFSNIVKSTLENGEEVFIRGFGSFVVKKRGRKVARNISKNTAIVIEEHYLPSFRPSKEFLDSIRDNKNIKL